MTGSPHPRPGRAPYELHRAYLRGVLTHMELASQLLMSGADEATIRREVPDPELVEEYLRAKARADSSEKTIWIGGGSFTEKPDG